MNRDDITPAGLAWQDFQLARIELARKLARESEIYLFETMWAAPTPGTSQFPATDGPSRAEGK